jgi:hypothetical protein
MVQANCVARLAPLVAGWGGAGASAQQQMAPAAADGTGDASSRGASSASRPRSRSLVLQIVRRATRVTQNSDEACSWACVGASILERVLFGSSIADAVAAVAQALEQGAAASATASMPAAASTSASASGDESPRVLEQGQGSDVQQNPQERQQQGGQGSGAELQTSPPSVNPGGGAAAAPAQRRPAREVIAGSLAPEIARLLRLVLSLAPAEPSEAIAKWLGRNCHAPNHLMSALQVCPQVYSTGDVRVPPAHWGPVSMCGGACLDCVTKCGARWH